MDAAQATSCLPSPAIQAVSILGSATLVFQIGGAVIINSVSWPATAGHPGDIAPMPKTYYVYILASERNGTLYIGVTNNLARRVWEHREGLVPGFTKTYSVKILVYYEIFDDIAQAIHREKRLKKYKREWKMNLIQKHNIEWRDLVERL